MRPKFNSQSQMNSGCGYKMGSDSSAENTPNAPEFICPNCLPKPKSSGFQWKKAPLGVRSPCFKCTEINLSSSFNKKQQTKLCFWSFEPEKADGFSLKMWLKNLKNEFIHLLFSKMWLAFASHFLKKIHEIYNSIF